MSQSRPAKVVFLDRETVAPQIVMRSLDFEHELVVHESTAPHQVAERIADADVVLVNKVVISAEAIAAARRLRLIAIAATGSDNVDLMACQPRGISVCNVRDYAVNTVAEHTFALIFALRRNLVAYRESVQKGRWAESGQFCFFDHRIRDLTGSVIGIIGDGILGKAVARMATALGLTVLFAAHKGHSNMGPLYTPFEEVMRRSDIVTLHCPLLPSTRDMVGDAEFALMERSPMVINTARGGLVNEPALVRALCAGRVCGAGFDVVTEEPLNADHCFNELLGRPDFILTPHVAWASEEAMQALTDQLCDNVDAFWRGEPRNLLTD